MFTAVFGFAKQFFCVFWCLLCVYSWLGFAVQFVCLLVFFCVSSCLVLLLKGLFVFFNCVFLLHPYLNMAVSMKANMMMDKPKVSMRGRRIQ